MDGYNLGAYNKVGLSNIGEKADLSFKGILSLQMPNLSLTQWKEYLNTVGTLAPYAKGDDWWRIPEGVKKLGGVFAIDNNNIVYGYEQGLPGDDPSPDEVVEALLDLF